MAEERGVEAVSMRALAAGLGIEAMSLYSHVPSKAVLLGLMAAHVINTVPTPSARLSPQRRLLALALGMRNASMKYPQVFPLVVLMPLDFNASVRPTEIALQAFVDAGLRDKHAIGAQRIFLSFVRGYLLWELGGFAAGRSRTVGGKARASVAQEIWALDASAFPQTRRLGGTFLSIPPDKLFQDGLMCLVKSMMAKSKRGVK